MPKWVWVFVATDILIVIVAAIFWLFQFEGLKYYLKAVYSINQLTAEEKVEAKERFYGPGEKGYYTGILARVNTKDFGSVWIWTHGLPRYFTADEYSVFSFFNFCNDFALETLDRETAAPVYRDVYTDVKVWAEKVKRGDFVNVQIAGEGHGGNPGKLREIYVYDWWVFMPIKTEELCAN